MTKVLGIACSRIGRKPERIMQVAYLIKTMMHQVGNEPTKLIAGRGTAIAPWLEVASDIWKIRIVWINQTEIRKTNCKARHHPWQDITTAHLASEDLQEHDKQVDGKLGDIDHKVIELSEVMYIPWIRRGGKIESLVRNQFAKKPSFRAYIGASSGSNANHFFYRKHVRWNEPACTRKWAVKNHNQDPLSRSKRTDNGGRRGQPEADGRSRWNIPAPLQSKEWLFHCTRAPKTRWPGEQEETYKRLILQNPQNALSRTPLDTLCRITTQKVLMAQATVSAHKHPVVCFSSRSLDSLLNARCYRPHLQRWDYEPFGIAISKAYAKRIGMRRVIYGNQLKTEISSEQQRYRLHPCGNTYDWSWEQEWRSPASIDLHRIPLNEICLFAEDSPTARMKLHPNRWCVHFVSHSDT